MIFLSPFLIFLLAQIKVNFYQSGKIVSRWKGGSEAEKLGEKYFDQKGKKIIHKKKKKTKKTFKKKKKRRTESWSLNQYRDSQRKINSL